MKKIEIMVKPLLEMDYLTTMAIREFLSDEAVINCYKVCRSCPTRGICDHQKCNVLKPMNSYQKAILMVTKKLSLDIVIPLLFLNKEEREELVCCLDYPFEH